jgi:hypothetical protein
MELPPESVIVALAERYGDFLVRHGKELGVRPLVLPNSEFFPDRFTGDEASATALVRRMQGHAAMADIPITVRVIESELGQGGGCGSGACATPAAEAQKVPRIIDDGRHWILQVPSLELNAPVVLTAMTARVLGHVFLVETAANPSEIAEPADVTADVAAVGLGFGALMLEGAYIYSKSCGGPHVGRVTRLSLPELAILSALFVQLGKHSSRSLMRELSTTQRAAVDDALEWAKSNGRLIERLRTDPARVASGDLPLEEAKPWLSRLFGRKSKAALPNETSDDLSFEDLGVLETTLGSSLRAKPPKERSAADEALRALVDEALNESEANAE